MSVGLLGFVGSVAGTPLSAKGSEIERSQKDSADQQRRVQSERSAADAAGISQTDGEDHQSQERDADGRRPWEQLAQRKGQDGQAQADEPDDTRAAPSQGDTGQLLDLTG